MKKKKNSFWADGFSIKETRFSMILAMTVVGFLYALFSHYETGDITGNLLDLVKFLLISVVGVNSVTAVSDVLQRRRENSGPDSYNDGVDEDNDNQTGGR